MSNPQPAKQAAAKAYCAFGLPTAFTIGAKSVNTINVAIQLKDPRGNKPSGVCYARAYLSDNADGSTLTATATTSAIAVGTNGVILATPVSGKMVDVISDTQGRFDLNIIQTASPVTYYLVLVMPDGSTLVSAAITF